MKKILLIIFLVGVLIAAGLTVFIFTFDLNRYRPQIEKQASSAVGHPVKIGNLSLAWRGGLAVQVDGVQILSNDEPVLKVQSAGAVLQLAPLLRHSIQIGSIFLDGADIRVSKNAEGKVEVQGLSLPSSGNIPDSAPSAQPQNASSTSSGSPAWTSFLINSLKLKDIHVYYEDDTPAFPVQLDLRNLELSVKNVSLFRPMEFEMAAALFGAKQNVHVSGRLKVSDQGAEISAENLKAETDLGALDLAELARSLPRLMAQIPVSSLKGKLKVNVEQFKIQNGKLNDFEADVTLADGQVSALGASPLLDHVQVTVNHFRLNAPVDFKIQSAVLSDDSNFSFQGRLETAALGRIVIGPAQTDFDLDRLNWNRVESFIPALRNAGLASPPEGRLHADIKRFDFQPKREPAGDIDFRYDQGRLKFKNFAQELSSVNLTGTLRGNQLNLDAWNMNLGTSPAEGRLNIQNLFTAPIFRSEVRARAINLASVLPAQPAGIPTPEGILSFELSVGGSGKVPEVILPSLSGTGHFRIEKPVVRNLNALQQIFTKLSAIPGVSDALNPSRMSDKLKDRLAKRDTTLETIDQEFALQNQNIHFDKFEVISPDFIVRGPVNATLDGVVDARPTVWIHQEIMAELTDRVRELSFALNPQGQLQVPLSISGKAPQLAVTPDVQFLLGEIVRNRSTQAAGQIAQRIAAGKGPGSLSQILGVKSYGDQASANNAPAESADGSGYTGNNDSSGAAAGNDSSSATSSPQPDDTSVPVKVYPSQQQKPQSLLDAFTGGQSQSGAGQAKTSNAELAAGLLNSFLSSNSNQKDNSNSSSSN